ncbi:hypothetical protein NDU88_000342 [Pleurodeles waltl]|uniref:Uncharacterized protein n=1 Tax=Pleurodeles waltl TaxID=8319 RepID=A0AAV7URX8_PLEWA|nr:hypothetical protein NDU88_000342 [Pleurodeles waltl]
MIDKYMADPPPPQIVPAYELPHPQDVTTKDGVDQFPQLSSTMLRQCDGSDRSDPHTSATGAAAAWDDPEVTPRSTFPIGSKHYPRDPGNLKGEITEFEGRRMVGEEVFQEASRDPIQKLARTQRKRRSLEASGIPEDGARPQRRTIAVPTWDEDRQPREANP